MVKTIEEYQNQIVKALKSIKRYNRGLDMQITSLATWQMDGLADVTIVEENRYGT